MVKETNIPKMATPNNRTNSSMIVLHVSTKQDQRCFKEKVGIHVNSPALKRLGNAHEFLQVGPLHWQLRVRTLRQENLKVIFQIVVQLGHVLPKLLALPGKPATYLVLIARHYKLFRTLVGFFGQPKQIRHETQG